MSTGKEKVLHDSRTKQLVHGQRNGDMRIEEKEERKPKSQIWNRVVFGTGIGLFTAGAVIAGGWWFTGCVSGVALAATREYFGLVRSTGISEEMTPPPRLASRACAIICSAMPLITLYVQFSPLQAKFFIVLIVCFSFLKLAMI